MQSRAGLVAQAAAEKILNAQPDPVVRLRLLRDVLQVPAAGLGEAKTEINANPWVAQLAREQRLAGSWGRFHTRDTAAQQKIITTEFAIDRGLALGLDASHPVFARAVDYLAQLLTGRLEFPDRAERNNRWPCGTQLFVAATLSKLKPNYPFVDQPWDLWAEIAAHSFVSGRYDPEAESEAHRALTGATVKDSYLVLNNQYALTLLSARTPELPEKLAADLFAWVWPHPRGIGYLGVPPAVLPVNAKPGELDRWFSTHELLARFPAWRASAEAVVAWLLDQRGADGLWDFGPRGAGSHTFPLSVNWRKPILRKFDWSTRVLALLARYSL